MAKIVISETTVGNINGFAVALSGIYKSKAAGDQPAHELIDVYVRGVLSAGKKVGDRLEINGEQWEITEIQERAVDKPLKKGEVSFRRVGEQ
jgi:hypothetical protein